MKRGLLILLLISIGAMTGEVFACSDSGETEVGGVVPVIYSLMVPESFNYNDEDPLTPGETSEVTGIMGVRSNIDWTVYVEDNSMWYIEPYGPGNGRMTKQDYDPYDPNPVQLLWPMEVTVEGTTVSLDEAPLGDPEYIVDGGPGALITKDAIFTQKVDWDDEQGSYKISVTFIIEPTV